MVSPQIFLALAANFINPSANACSSFDLENIENNNHHRHCCMPSKHFVFACLLFLQWICLLGWENFKQKFKKGKWNE